MWLNPLGHNTPSLLEQPRGGPFQGHQNVTLNRGLIVEDGQLKLVTDPPGYLPLAIDPDNPPSGPVKRGKRKG
jgi:hypothetical protein